jgi:rare lipoprotein A
MANGRPFDADDYTAAHKTLPFGTELAVSYGGETVRVTVTDRGPYVAGRELDISLAAAQKIGLTGKGEAPVRVDVLS